MRREGEGVAFDIVIRAPTLGLATRTPSNQPKPRASSSASNVRFDQGVARNAEGYLRLITDPILDKPTFLFFQGQVSKDGRTLFPAIIGTQNKIWSVLRFPVGYTPPVCYAGDPLSNTPVWGNLVDNVGAVSSDVYGLQAIDAVRRETSTTFKRNWTICDNIDYCDGPDEEGESQARRYDVRWVVQPNEDATGFEYGIAGGTLIPVPPTLFPSVDMSTITTITLSFDGNARPVFAYQTAPGSLTLTRAIAGVPTIDTFTGDWPTLFYDGLVQRDTASRDVVLFYVRAGSIKSRFQRDNYATEREFFSASDIVPVKITKTDRVTPYHHLYYYDESNRLRMARSTPYPPFPVEVDDVAVSTGEPVGGEYSPVAVDGGTYLEFTTNIAAPAGGEYASNVIQSGPYVESATNLATPSGGEYPQISVDGGTYSESAVASASVQTGEYTLVAVDGGTYLENTTNSAAPAGGSYA